MILNMARSREAQILRTISRFLQVIEKSTHSSDFVQLKVWHPAISCQESIRRVRGKSAIPLYSPHDRYIKY